MGKRTHACEEVGAGFPEAPARRSDVVLPGAYVLGTGVTVGFLLGSSLLLAPPSSSSAHFLSSSPIALMEKGSRCSEWIEKR